MSLPTSLRPLCLHPTLTTLIDWQAQAYPDLSLASAGHCAPRQPLTTIELIRHVPAVRPPVTAILQGHTLIVAVAGKLRLRADSGDLGHCGVGGSQRGRRKVDGRRQGQLRHCQAGRGLWCPVSGHVVWGRLSKGKEHMVDTSTAHEIYVWHRPHTQLTCHTHATTTPHTCRPHLAQRE